MIGDHIIYPVNVDPVTPMPTWLVLRLPAPHGAAEFAMHKMRRIPEEQIYLLIAGLLNESFKLLDACCLLDLPSIKIVNFTGEGACLAVLKAQLM